MGEPYLVEINKELNFEGIFDMDELFRIIDNNYRSKGFDKQIYYDDEYETEQGKYFYLKYDYYKKVDSYVRIVNRYWIHVDGVMPMSSVIDGEKIEKSYGKISINCDCLMETEYFQSFPDSNPVYFLLRVFIEKYVLKAKIDYWKNVTKFMLTECLAEVLTYLNMNKLLYDR